MNPAQEGLDPEHYKKNTQSRPPFYNPCETRSSQSATDLAIYHHVPAWAARSVDYLGQEGDFQCSSH